MELNQDLNLVPEWISDWKRREVKYIPGEKDDDGQVVLWYKLENGKRIPCAAMSELMVITGPQKSRKTLLQSCMLMSNYIEDQNRTLAFEMDLGGAPILHFDTEQPLRRSKKNMRKFHDIIERDEHVDDYRFLNIKSLNTAQKLDFITYHIQKTQDDFGVSPGIIIIDQLADLCPGRDVNNDVGVDLIYNSMNHWQALTKEKTLLSVIVHTNRGRMNTNGKLGVMLDQKTDCTFHVDIDFDTWESKVTHKEAREMRIPKFSFRQDFNGYPKLLQVEDFDHENHI